MMDLGAFQIENDELVLYGGFNDGPSRAVWFYKTQVGNEGEFYDGKELQDEDFFPQNGVHLRLPNRQLIFPGHKFMHLFNSDQKAFTTLKTYE
jgi:hypothetical protein